MFPLILTDDVPRACRFYLDLFGFESSVDVGWYVQLAHPEKPDMQLAFMDQTHDSIPEAYRASPAGVVITLETDDADRVYARARELALPLHGEVKDEEWGQRHFITEDPTGLLVDVVQPIPPTQAFLERYGLSQIPGT